MNVLPGFEFFGEFHFDWQSFSARLSLTLLHFLWQGLVAGLIMAFTVRLMRRSSANSRYLIASALLFCLPIVALLTFSFIKVPEEFIRNADSSVVAMNSGETAIPNVAYQTGKSGAFEKSIPIEAQSSLDSETANPIQSQRLESTTRFGPTFTSACRFLCPWMPWLAILYVSGVTLMWLRLLTSLSRGARLRSRSTVATDANLLSLVEELTRKLGLKVAPAIYYCEQIMVPAVVGVLKPAILLPASLVSNLAPQELAAILRHELAHVRRFDPAFQLIQKTIESLFFFHPVVWWISRQVSTERENCCDDLAAAGANGKVEYASALLRIAELSAPDRSQKITEQMAALSAAGTRPNQLSRRIERLLEINKTPLASPRFFPAVVVFMLLAGIASLAVIASSSTTLIDSDIESVATETDSSTGNSMSATDEEESPLKKAIESFNQENKRLEIGLNQKPLTEDEVVTAIKNAVWERDSGRLNEAEFAVLKGIAESRQFPDGAYFSVYSHQQPEPFIIKHFWHVDLFVPAIGHDGFVPFTVRHTDFADEKIDPKSIAWGDPDADGMTLGTRFSPYKASYKSGERVRLLMFVRNDGTETVSTTWSNLTEPGAGGFTVTDDRGDNVDVILAHEKWALAMVSGAMGGGLQPGATHAFTIPFEVRIGGLETKGANKLIGRIIDAKPGQKLKLKVRSTTGNNRTRRSKDSWVDTGTIEFAVAEEPAIHWGRLNNGLRLGIRPVSFAEKTDKFVHGDWIRYEVWIRNETDSAIEIPRDPATNFVSGVEGEAINLTGSSFWVSFDFPQQTYDESPLNLESGKSALLLLHQSIQAPIVEPGTEPKEYGPRQLELATGVHPIYANLDVSYNVISSTGGKSELKTTNVKSGEIRITIDSSPAASPDNETAATSSSTNEVEDKVNKIPLDQVVWWDAGDGLEAGFLLRSSENPHQRVPLNSLAEYKILVRNKSDKDITFLARLIPHELKDAPYLIPSDDINAALDAEELPEKFRSKDGPSHTIEPAYVITLTPGESAIIRNQRANDDLGLYVGYEGESEYPRVTEVRPGMNWIVQPLQLHVPPPDGGTQMFGQAYTLTKVDREGKTRREMANRRGSEPGGKTVYSRIQLEVGTLNAAAARNADQVTWGEVDKGLQCGIRLLNPKQTYQIGDMLESEIFWRNTSTETIETPFPMKLDLYPSITDSKGNYKWIDFGGRFMLYPGTYPFKAGEIRSLGVTKIKLVADGTPSPSSNAEPGHITLEAGTYKLIGSGGVSGPNTGDPLSGEIEFTVVESNKVDEAEDKNDRVEISGQVIGVDGKPLAGVPLAVDYITEKTAHINAQQLHSDANGRFNVGDLPKDARLFVRYSRWPGRDDPVDPSVNFAIVEIASDAADRDNITLDLAKSNGTIQGKLVNKDGKGVAKADVSINYGPTSSRLDQSQRATTDADGKFKVTGLPPASYVVSATIEHSQLSERVTTQLDSGKTIDVELHDFFQGSPAPQREVEPAWGKKYDEGLQAGIIVDPIRKEYAKGDLIRARIILRNTGDQPANVTHAKAQDRLHLAINSTKKETEWPRIEIFDYSRFTGWVATSAYLIQPGHEVEVAQFSLQLKSTGLSGHSKGDRFELAVEDNAVVELIASLGDGLNGIGLHKMPDEDGDSSFPATGRFKIKVRSDK